MTDIVFLTESDMTNIAFVGGATEEGKAWIAENIEAEITHPFGIVVEKRYISEIVEGIKDAGLTASGDYL
jgi:hypothetical protein